MILQKYTPAKTDALIASIHRLADNITLIGEASCLLMERAYEKYIENFNPGIFFWRIPYTMKEIVYKMNPYGYAGSIQSYDNIHERGAFCELLPKDYRTFRVYNSMSCVDTTVFAKQGVTFTKDEFDLLVDATSIWNSTMYNPIDGFNKKIRIVLKYAKRPFEIEEGDIPFIEEMNRLVSKSDDIVNKHGLR